MDYFCYIARSKVDQLYQSLSEQSVEEWVEKRMTEHDVAVDAKADWNIARVVQLFKAGITYGRKGVIQREQKVKLHYVQKLRVVLLSIAAQRAIPSLELALLRPPLAGRYFYVDAAFRVVQPVGHGASSTQVVTLAATVSGHDLVLDCSLGNFSEGNQPEGHFSVNSTNARFFGDAAMPLQLEAVIVLLASLNSEIVATPLFLKLSDASPVVL
jgi:hypothetical protein